MENALYQYVSKFPSLSEEEVQGIIENMTVRTFRKGTLLLKAGEIYTECYFVLEGCVRQYLVVDEVEKTTAFFTEEQAVVSFSSYAEQIASKYYLACVEDSLLIIGDLSTEQEMYQKFPKLAPITRAITEQEYGETQETLASFITSSPEERYLNLLKTRPELLQKAPQHQIASYLGMTPESLSRIRKRVAKRK
jgi:CRP-like cAMP-binding protein